ncbi:MAG: Na+/H+ antiporter NhaC family protein, partial [Spirochaetota bacterium]
IPVIVVVMMLNKANFFTAILIAELLGIVMLFPFGYLKIANLVAKDGLIASGFSGMVNSIIFLLFIFFVVSLIREAGVLEAFLKSMRKFAKSDLTAEIAAGGMVSLMSIAISSGTSAITFCGPIIRGLLRPFKIDRARAANFLDGLGCGVGYLVPTNAGCMVLASLAVTAGVVKEGYNPINFVIFNFHSMALVIIFWFAILSGWGRKHETDEELLADGIDISESEAG